MLRDVNISVYVFPSSCRNTLLNQSTLAYYKYYMVNNNLSIKYTFCHSYKGDNDRVIMTWDILIMLLYRFFRLQNKRPLKNLLVVNEGGCGRLSPGIGDISYVKDLQTGKIVTTKFRCSHFGTYYPKSSKYGWVSISRLFYFSKRMNKYISALQNH